MYSIHTIQINIFFVQFSHTNPNNTIFELFLWRPKHTKENHNIPIISNFLATSIKTSKYTMQGFTLIKCEMNTIRKIGEGSDLLQCNSKSWTTNKILELSPILQRPISDFLLITWSYYLTVKIETAELDIYPKKKNRKKKKAQGETVLIVL